MTESESNPMQPEDTTSKRSLRAERRDPSNATAAETGPTRRQWGKSALTFASASLIASGCGRGTHPDDKRAESKEVDRRNELIVKVVNCATPNTFGYEHPGGVVRICTRQNRAIMMILDQDSVVDSVYVSQAKHNSAPPGQDGFHNFAHLFAVHPGPSFSEDRTHSFELTKTKPAIFVLKTIQDPEGLKPRQPPCTFLDEDRPHARCINFEYRIDKTTGEALGHCPGPMAHTDYHVEC